MQETVIRRCSLILFISERKFRFSNTFTDSTVRLMRLEHRGKGEVKHIWSQSIHQKILHAQLLNDTELLEDSELLNDEVSLNNTELLNISELLDNH